MIRAAIVGAGMMGATHAAGIAQLPNVELASVMDLLPGKAQALADRYGGTAVETLDDILDDGSIELVVCTTSTESHRDVSVRALEAGKHVFCEKPSARRL